LAYSLLLNNLESFDLASRLRPLSYRNRGDAYRTVLELRAEHDYRLWIRFDDGLEGHVYLGELMRTPAYGALVGEDDFFKVVVDPISKVLTWVGGVRLQMITKK